MESLIHQIIVWSTDFFLLFFLRIDEPLDRKLFALQEHNTQKTLLFGGASPASGPRLEAMGNGHGQQLEGVAYACLHLPTFFT